MGTALLEPPLAAREPTHASGLLGALEEVTTPLVLPSRIDGRAIRHLSASSYELWQRCEEKWRRRYLLGEKEPGSPAMFLGSAVDHALTWMYQQQIDGQRPEIGDVKAAYEQLFDEHEDDRRQIVWTDGEPESLIRGYGAHCVEVFIAKLAPLVGTPVAVQREISFKLNDACSWTITGFIDLESVREVPVQITDKGLLLPLGAAPPDRHRVVAHSPAGVKVVHDYKVKGDYISKAEADGLVQPSIYMLDRRFRGDPADAFAYANLVRPGGRRAGFDGRLIHTTRTEAQMVALLVRFAQMAHEICDRVARFGYEQPWKFADPGESFPCRRRFCAYVKTCPGWSGA